MCSYARVHPQVYGGMRGMKGLVYETSVLDPDEVSAPQNVTAYYGPSILTAAWRITCLIGT